MRHDRGFTLVETLVAFAILAVVLGALYEAMGTGLRGLDTASRTDQALMLAQSELDRLTAMKTISSDAMQGTLEGTTFRWRAEILPDTQPEPEHLRVSPLRLQKLRLVVSWRDGAREREIAVEKALLLQRGWGG